MQRRARPHKADRRMEGNEGWMNEAGSRIGTRGLVVSTNQPEVSGLRWGSSGACRSVGNQLRPTTADQETKAFPRHARRNGAGWVAVCSAVSRPRARWRTDRWGYLGPRIETKLDGLGNDVQVSGRCHGHRMERMQRQAPPANLYGLIGARSG